MVKLFLEIIDAYIIFCSKELLQMDSTLSGFQSFDWIKIRAIFW